MRSLSQYGQFAGSSVGIELVGSVGQVDHSAHVYMEKCISASLLVAVVVAGHRRLRVSTVRQAPRRISLKSNTHRRRDATVELSRVGAGGVYWA